MKILRVKKFPLFDVFLGLGWKNWSRIQLNKDKSMEIVGGAELSKSEKFKVSTEILNKIKEQ